ncbi:MULTISPECIES: hypothetical protein [Fischerella]|uniref:hypothetical protein n=1 Tax=Fischerella TaxID=1190 RepID=UPI0002FC4800|nr:MULTISPECIES: hypothetical protein [Fischerella]
MAGTLMRGIAPDSEASLRVLLDRNLRAAVVPANQANSNLQRSNVDGICCGNGCIHCFLSATNTFWKRINEN